MYVGLPHRPTLSALQFFVEDGLVDGIMGMAVSIYYMEGRLECWRVILTFGEMAGDSVV